MCGLGSKSSKKSKDPYAKENARRAAAVTEGMAGIDAQFAGFDDGYYQGRANDYVSFAKPQVEDQYKKSLEQLVFALSRSSNLNSSAGAQARADLQRQKDVRSREVVDGARSVANKARADVADQRQNLISMLNSTYDPSATMESARSRTEMLNSAPSFDTLGDLFTLPAGLAANEITQQRLNGGAARGGAQIFQNPAGGSPSRVVA